jgi:hypothetical protein
VSYIYIYIFFICMNYRLLRVRCLHVVGCNFSRGLPILRYYYLLVSVKHNYHYISYLNNRVSMSLLHVSVLYDHHQVCKSCNIHFFVCNCLFVLTNWIPFVSQFLSTSLVKVTVFVYCKIIKLNYSRLI